MSTLFDEISKEVGYAHRKINYPSVREVRDALSRKSRQDIFNLVMWHRNLVPAETARQRTILDLVDNGLETMVL
jgi:hypothetical protein